MRSKTKIHYCYKDKRNETAFNESLCLAILCNYAEITLKKPAGKSFVAHAFFPIESIRFENNDAIDFETIIEKRIQDRKQIEVGKGLYEETAVSRMKKNRMTESVHLLYDILEELGVFFNKSYSNGKNNAMVIDYIDSIFFDKYVITRDQINVLGQIINKAILTQIGKNQHYTLKKDDAIVVAVLYKFLTEKGIQKK